MQFPLIYSVKLCFTDEDFSLNISVFYATISSPLSARAQFFLTKYCLGSVLINLGRFRGKKSTICQLKLVKSHMKGLFRSLNFGDKSVALQNSKCYVESFKLLACIEMRCRNSNQNFKNRIVFESLNLASFFSVKNRFRKGNEPLRPFPVHDCRVGTGYSSLIGRPLFPLR